MPDEPVPHGDEDRARRLIQRPRTTPGIVQTTPPDDSDKTTDDLIERLGRDIKQPPPRTTSSPPRVPVSPPENPPTYGPGDPPPPHRPEDPPPPHRPDDSQLPLCCGMTKDVISYPITSDPMHPPLELEAPESPAIGAYQVYLHDGAFFTNQTDLAAAALFYDIEWTRHLRSDATFAEGGLMGHGWDFGFNKRIVPIAPKDPQTGLFKEKRGTDHPQLMYYNGTGRGELYVESTTAPSEVRTVLNFDSKFIAYVTTYKSPPGQFHEIERYVLLGDAVSHPFGEHPNVAPNERIFYVLRVKHGTRYVFNCRGQLIYIVSRNDSPSRRIRVELRYDESRFNPLTQNPMLAKIVDATHREYDVDVIDIGRAGIATNFQCKLKTGLIPVPRIKGVKGAGVTVEYNYRNGNSEPYLESAFVRASGARAREWQYKYEAGSHLTEIKDPNECGKGGAGKPYLVNAYAGDQVTSQVLGDPAKSAQTFSIASGARAVVTDGAANRREYDLEASGGFHVVAKQTVVDTDSKHAGPWVTQYRHNDDTQVTELTLPNGNGVTYEYEPANRTVTLGPIRDKAGAYTYKSNLAKGNLLRVTRHAAQASGTVARDPGVQYSGPSTAVTSQAYDELYNEVIEARDDLGSVTVSTISDYDTPRFRGNARKLQFPPVAQPEGAAIKVPVQTVTYNEYAQRDSIDDGLGHITRFQYDPGTRYLRRTDFPGGAFERLEEYDALGNVGRRTTLDGAVRYERDGFGQMKWKTVDPDGLAVRTAYDYDAVGNPTEIRTEVKDTFAKSGAPVPDAAPYWIVEHTDYDILNRKEKVTRTGKDLSEETTYFYSRSGDLEWMSEPSLDDKSRLATGYCHDARHLLREKVQFGQKFELPRDGKPCGTIALARARTAASDGSPPERRTDEREYDGNGNVTRVRVGIGNDMAERTMHYNGLDRLDMSTSELGARTNLVYDDGGNTVETSVRKKDGTLLKHAKFKHDAYQHVIERVVDSLDGASSRSRFYYSARRLLARTISPNGAETVYGYDDQGRIQQVQGPLDVLTETHYDARGNPDQVTVTGTAVTFADDGKLVRQKGARIQSTTNRFDNLGRVTEVTTLAAKERRFLDSLGHDRATVASSGLVTSFEYDGLGRLAGMRTPVYASSRKYTAGGLLKVSDEPDGKHEMGYDAIGRVVQRKDLRSGGVTRYRYLDGHKTEVTDPRGVAIETTYNESELPKSVVVTKIGGMTATIPHFPDSPGTFEFLQGQRQQGFEYDELGRLTRATAGSYEAPADVEVGRKYDGLDRLVEEQQRWSGTSDDSSEGALQTVRYRFDPSLRWSETIYPAAAGSIRYRTAVDAAGRVTALSRAGQDIASYIYTGMDGIALRRLANGFETRFSYDDRSRLETVSIARSSAEYHSDPLRDRTWKGIAFYNDATGMRETTVDIEYARDDAPEVRIESRVTSDPAGRTVATESRRQVRAKGKPAVTDVSGSFSEFGPWGQLQRRADFTGLAAVPDDQTDRGYRTVRMDTLTYDDTTRRVTKTQTLGASLGKASASLLNAPSATAVVDHIAAVERAAPTGKTNARGMQEFKYDQNGNMISDGRYLYAYDFKNRLVRVQDTKSPFGYNESVRFTYDALDRRVGVSPARNDGERNARDAYWTRYSTRFIYGGDAIIAELELRAHPALLATYFHGSRPGELVRMDRLAETARERGANGVIAADRPLSTSAYTLYVHDDLNGNVRFLTDADGGVHSPRNEFPVGETSKTWDQAPGDRLVVSLGTGADSTTVRVPYVAPNTRVDGFAGTTFQDDAKRPVVDYRSAAEFAEVTAHQAQQAWRQELTDHYQSMFLEIASVPVAVAVAPGIVATEGMVGNVMRAGLEQYAFSVAPSFVTNEWNAYDVAGDVGKSMLRAAAAGVGGKVLGSFGVNAAAGGVQGFLSEVAVSSAVGTTWDVYVGGAGLDEALKSNLINNTLQATAHRGIGWVAGKVNAHLMGAATEAAERVPRLASAVAEETKSRGNTMSCESFVPGTPVVTTRGNIPIEQLRPGDEVLSRNPATGETSAKRVTGTMGSAKPSVMSLSVEWPEGGTLRRGQIGVTAPHPLWSLTRSAWVRADDIHAGESLLMMSGTAATVLGAGAIEAANDESFATHNLEIEDWHTYFVAPAADATDGVLAHNMWMLCQRRNIGGAGGSLIRVLEAIDDTIRRLEMDERLAMARFGTIVHAVRAKVLRIAGFEAEVLLQNGKRLDELRFVRFGGKNATYIGDLVSRADPNHVAKGYGYLHQVRAETELGMMKWAAMNGVARHPAAGQTVVIYEEFYYNDPELVSRMWVLMPGQTTPTLHAVRKF